MSQRFDVRPSVLYENRYCDQNEFDIIINFEEREIKDTTNSIFQTKNDNVKCNVVLISILANRCFAKTAVVGSDIFVIGGYDNVIKASCVDNRSKSTWKNLTLMPDSRIYFSVCSFMNSLYLIGGYLENDSCSRESYKYQINHNKWTKIADLNIDRSQLACVVFEGKIVATGGHMYSYRTKSAESYDHHKNKWSHLPDMIGWRYNHSSFSMGNKFFVIGGYSNSDAEIFDSTSRKFTLLNLKLPCENQFLCDCETVSISRKMFVLCSSHTNKLPMLHVYIVDEKSWVFREIVKSVRYIKPIIY